MPVRTIVITGASTGIGEACALDLDRLGFRVYAGVRSDEAGQRLAAQASPQLVPLPLDVTNAAQIHAAAERVQREVGSDGLAGLVNNAGIAVPGPLELLSIDQVRQQFEVNVLGPLAVTQAFLPLLRAGRGRIVNMSSGAGLIALPLMGAYAASKFALEAISDCQRIELHRFGIHVAAVEPSNVATPIWKKTQHATELRFEGAPADRMQLYEQEVAALYAISNQAAEDAMPVEHVVKAVRHALCSRRPRARYPVGGSSWIAARTARFLPDRLRDWIVRRVLKLR